MKYWHLPAIVLLLLVTFWQGEGLTQEDFQVEQVAQDLGIPWGMSFLSRDEIIFSERSGAIKLLNLGSSEIETLAGAPRVWARGQGGMLDVAVEPNYQPGGWIYFTYCKPDQGRGATVLARAKLHGKALVNWQELLETLSTSTKNVHFGSRIAFDDMGHVFFGVGDRGVRASAQDLSNHAGSIIRLQLDGSIPPDNPFIARKNARPEIWSYGHRNPQGIVFDYKQQRLWVIEHGPRGGDEINLIKPGRNYGWPVISYGKEYWGPVAVGEGVAKRGMEQPVKYYTPSIAPGSLLLYSGHAFPHMRGNLLAGALKLRHLNRIVLNSAGKPAIEERLLHDMGERIRALAQSPEGWIYFSTDSGRIMRMRPKNTSSP